jgi:hypothetical protein
MVYVGLAMILLVAGLTGAWAARLLRVGMRDAQDLAAKLAVPRPVSQCRVPCRRRNGPSSASTR